MFCSKYVMLGASKSISGFDPRSVGGCSLWLDGADPNTMTFSSGSNISAWKDKASGLSASNSTAINQPSYVPASQNGLGTVFFDAAAGLKRLDLPAFSFGTTSRSAFFVMKNIASANYNSSVLGGYPHFFWDRSNGNNTNAWTPVGWVQLRVPDASGNLGFFTYYLPLNQYIIYEIVYSSSTIRTYQSGTQIQTIPTISAMYDATNGYSLGGLNNGDDSSPYPYRFYGNIAEVILYNSALTTDQRQAVEGYLAWKWGLQSPSSSPADIPGLALWLDAADPASTGTGTSISTWRDKSATGNHFTNVGAACSNIMDGSNRVVRFPNTACMVSSSSITFTTSSAFYFVFKNTAFNVLNYAVDFPNIVQNAQQAGDFSVRFSSSVLYGANGATDVNSLANGNYWINGVFNTYSGAYSGVYMMIGTLQPTVGGTSTIAISLPPATTSSNYSGRYFIGNFAELLYYPAGLTNAQRQSVEAYLSKKWEVSVPNQVLPLANPFRSIRPLTRYFNPVDIPGCQLWLDAADPTSVTGTTTVTQWRDKSGNGRHLGVGSGTTSYANNAITLNSSYMFVTSVVDLTAFTFFFVVKANSATNNQTVFIARPLSVYDFRSTEGFGFYMDYQTSTRLYGQDSSGAQVSTNALTTSSPNIFAYTSGSTVINASINGSPGSGASSLSPRTSSALGFAIGAYWNLTDYAVNVGNVSIYEAIVFNNALTSSQRQQIEGYLAGKWGLRSSIPAAHSFKTIPPSTALPFSPTNISGCALWLDAADSSTVVFSSSSNISSWIDKSGNGRSGTASNSPVLTSGQQAGLPVVTLASASSQYFDFGNTLNLGTNALTIFFVGKTTLGAVNRGLIAKSSARGLAGRWFLINESGVGLYFAVDPAAAGTTNTITTSTTTSGQFAIYSAVTERTSSNYLYTNGKLVASTSFVNSTNFSTSDKLYVGAYPDSTGLTPVSGFYYDGTIGEIIVYNAILSTVQRQQVEGYLAWKWDLVSRIVYPIVTGNSSVVNNAAWTAYIFTSTSTSGILMVPNGKTVIVDYLLVGGGGGASGYIGGGGGGGYYVYTTSTSFTPGTYTISIGTGGTGQVGTSAPSPTGGGNTTIVKSGTTIATGPGGGGAAPIGGSAGSSGPFTGGSYNEPTINSGGGAGAGGNGANGGANGGNGGVGVQNSITGTATYYGGGGGGGWYTGNVPGTGGAGGGANGAIVYNPGSSNNGTNGLGGGGGGSTGGGNSIGGNGGSGVAIIRIYS